MLNFWSDERLSPGKKEGDDDHRGHRTIFEQDYDRILFSSAVRRLSDKTQVFPLDTNDSVRTRLDEQFALAATATRPGVWVTYAIHDPTQPDHIEGRAEGLIRYVGQSKRFVTRVRDRMTTAGRAVKHPTDKIDGLLYDIMSRGPAPRWTVLEEVHSAIESLVSETNWTIRLRAKGYPLVNQWTEHKLGTLEVDRYAIDHKRLWPITTSDAIGSDIDVVVRDAASGEEIVVDLSLFRPTTRLQEIKADAKAKGRRARLIVR